MSANAYADSSSQSSASAQIQTLFNNLEITGNAYNGGGGSAAFNAALSSGCSALSGSSVVQDNAAHMLSGLADNMDGNSSFLGKVTSYGNRLGQQGVTQILGAGCSALTGGSLSSSGSVMDGAMDQLRSGLVGGAQSYANSSGLPFLSHLEIEAGTERRQWVSSLTTIQPLWHDAQGRNHVFTQLAWRTVDGEHTLNTGLAYRYLNSEKTVLYGLNTFFDHAFNMNHNRMSVGADMQTSLWGMAFNKYIPLSGWKVRDLYWEEKAAAGVDLEVHGQMPSLPSWTGSIKGYQWDGAEHQNDDPANPIKNTLGYVTSLEYAPFNALALRAGLRHETVDGTSGEMALRFNVRLDEPWDMQFKPRLELASVADRVYQKVSRENTIRVESRRRDLAYLSVLQTVGANTVSGQPGVLSLMVGQSIVLPTTLTVANTVGAVVRLQFSDGAYLTAGQGTQVTIAIDKITLITGTAQYTAGSTTRVVNVPGATITLLGTDIDMSSNGTTSNVRVREGSVRVEGTVSGNVTLNQAQMATAVAGTVSNVAVNSGPYIAYTDQVSTQIDRVATPVAGGKVAPYPDAAPRIVTTATTPGSTITIGLQFNTAVTVSGGTPRLNFTINGNSRTADLSAGSGTNDLKFSYTLQGADTGVSTLTVTGLDANGATISGEGKTAITTIADSTVDLSGTVAYASTLSINFLTNTYSLMGTTYNTFSSFLSAVGGTFARSSTGTYFDASGVMQTAASGAPRLDYDPATHAAKGLLMENGRSNVMLDSADFTTGNWYANGVTVTSSGTSPAGTTAQLFTATSVSANTGYVNQGQTGSFGTFTLTIYAKAGSSNNVTIQPNSQIDSSFTGFGVVFDLSAVTASVSGGYGGHFSNISPSISAAGNGWYRCAVTYTVTGTTYNDPMSFWIYPYLSGASAGASVYFWGAQLEQGAYATSYIPTNGSAVGRATDTLNMPTGSWYTASEGTMAAAADFAGQVSGEYPGIASLENGPNDQMNFLLIDGTNQTDIEILVGNSNKYTATGSAVAAGAVFRQALAYKATDTRAAINGTLAAGSGSVSLPTATLLRLGTIRSGLYPMTGHIGTFQYFPIRVPDATLQSLSSP